MQGDVPRQLALTFILGIVGAAGVGNRGSRFLLSFPKLFIPIVAWCWLSVFWAIDAEIAFRRVGLTTMVILSVMYCVNQLTYQQTFGLLLAFFVLLVTADLLAVLTLPMAVHPEGEVDASLVGDWRGLQDQKNLTGAFAGVALILFAHETFRRRLLVGGIAIAAAFGFCSARDQKLL